MRHSQRRRIAKREREYLKGSDTESPRYRHALLTGVRQTKASSDLAVMSVLFVAFAAFMQRADYLAAVGAVVAVLGVLRFRTGYVQRIKATNAAYLATLPDGGDDAAASEARL